MIGMPPATAASKAMMTCCLLAAAKISLPYTASSALLAVTTCLPWAIASSTSSRAISVPPISSHDDVDARIQHDLVRIVGDRDGIAHDGPHPRRVAHRDARHFDVAAGAAPDLLAIGHEHLGNAAADGAVTQQADADRPQGRLARDRQATSVTTVACRRR